MKVVDRLKYLVKLSGLSQGVLADRIGVSLVAFNAWANDRSQPRAQARRVIDELCAEFAVGSPYAFSDLFVQSETGGSSEDLTAELDPHQLEQLLNGGGDRAAIEVLRQHHYLELLKKLASIIQKLPDGVLTESTVLLDAAKERDAQACKEVLMYPYCAKWVQRVLSKLEDAEGAFEESDVAQFASIVAVCAWKSGLSEFRISVRLVDGALYLPALGKVSFWDELDATRAFVVCANGELSVATEMQSIPIPSDPQMSTENWEGIKTFSWESAGLQLELAIDDVDPFRAQDATHSNLIPMQLGELDLKQFKEDVSEAWEIIANHHPYYAESLASGLCVIVPLQGNGLRHMAASYQDVFGTILMTIGPNHAWTAQGLLEEFQRTKVRALHALIPLYKAGSNSASNFVAFRDSLAPFSNLVETFYAASATAQLWLALHKSALSSEKFEAGLNYCQRRSWEESLLVSLMDSEKMTDLGKRMLELIYQQVDQLEDDVSQVTHLAVRNMLIDQRLTARLNNLTVDLADLQRLALTRKTGRSCPTNKPVRLVVRREMQQVVGRSKRRLLDEMKISHPDKFNELMGNSHYLEIVAPGAQSADVFAIAGYFAEAADLYEKTIEADATNLEAWAGLAFVAALSEGSNSLTLGRFPELVAALYQELKAIDAPAGTPEQLAKWLEPLLLRMDDSVFEGEGQS